MYQKIETTINNQVYEMALADNGSPTQKKPTVLIFHSWAGRDEFVCKKAEEIAGLGYVGVAIDLYGKGKVGTTREENQKLMSPLAGNRKLLRRLLQANLEKVLGLPNVDHEKIVAIGYCFGGLCALDLARSGAKLTGFVSIHGILAPPEGLKTEKIHSKILVLQGYNDPMATPDQVVAFEKEMSESGADWQVHVYGNTMHAFTNPEVNDPSFGLVFSPKANERSWQSIKNFFDESFNASESAS